MVSDSVDLKLKNNTNFARDVVISNLTINTDRKQEPVLINKSHKKAPTSSPSSVA